MSRPDRDQLGLLLAHVWALRGTCARRKVGCVLFDRDGYQLSSGYNGPASGQAHCDPSGWTCPGADAPSGESLHMCEAIHAEQNAIARCADVRRIDTCYVTASPCIHCVKMLMNTGCRRIVFAERYAHDAEAERLWRSSTTRHFRERVWDHLSFDLHITRMLSTGEVFDLIVNEVIA